MRYPEVLDGSRDASWYRAEAMRLREWGNRITHDAELQASYFSLAREYEGLADILDGKDAAIASRGASRPPSAAAPFGSLVRNDEIDQIGRHVIPPLSEYNNTGREPKWTTAVPIDHRAERYQGFLLIN